MSGILGILNLDGAPATAHDLASMASPLERRGPDRTGLWCDGSVGLGHTLLTTTPELAFEPQPVKHAASGCVITADVRLDNRQELLAALRMSERADVVGDAGLILEAYLAWGAACVDRFLGDFAFAIWDPRRRAMFCARDQFGMRPFYYHHVPGRLFVLASEPRAILVLPQVPHQINEGRIADYLVPELEWIDYTSTFFEHVFRLPPAHAITATPEGLNVRRYWTLEPGPELRLPSNDAYAEAMLDVLTESVRSRLRGAGPVGAMLSGGLDSSSVVAVARDLLSQDGGLPLSTFSAVGPDPEACIETRSVHAALAMEGLKPTLVDYSALQQLLPELEDASWALDEPFDIWAVLVRAMYLSARQQGVRVLLDGGGGDVLLNEGTHVIRLFRQGHWITALREARALDRFYGARLSVANPLRSVKAALTPNVVRRLGLQALLPWRAANCVRGSLISPEFARRISLADRLRTLDRTFQRERGLIPDYQQECASAIHPNMTAGRERYDRVAAASAVEPRDPFLDRRVVAFCLTLPGAQRQEGGWPKVILRRAMAGRLPDAVRWRRGRSHLGLSFVTSLMGARVARMGLEPDSIWQALSPFVDRTSLRNSWQRYFSEGDAAHEERVYDAVNLAVWLQAPSLRFFGAN